MKLFTEHTNKSYIDTTINLENLSLQPVQSSRISILHFFRFQKNTTLTFFEMTYQKVVKIFSKSLVLNPSK